LSDYLFFQKQVFMWGRIFLPRAPAAEFFRKSGWKLLNRVGNTDQEYTYPLPPEQKRRRCGDQQMKASVRVHPMSQVYYPLCDNGGPRGTSEEEKEITLLEAPVSTKKLFRELSNK
jgi:hypothetical protein